MSRYTFRILAAAYLLSIAIMMTSTIGKTPTGVIIDWIDAWTAVMFCISIMLLGYLAGCEHQYDRGAA